jgi:hypothetical protein
MKEDVVDSQFSHFQQDGREAWSHGSRVENHRDMATLPEPLDGLSSMLCRQQRRVHDKCHGWGLQIEKSELHPIL